jgi:hypothetical protein
VRGWSAEAPFARWTGLQPFLGVGATEAVKLYVIMSPVGPYYPEGFNPIKLYADTESVRAWPGGAGNTKVSDMTKVRTSFACVVGSGAVWLACWAAGGELWADDPAADGRAEEVRLLTGGKTTQISSACAFLYVV